MPVVGLAEVLIKPVFSGAQQAISRAIVPAAADAGKDAGIQAGRGLSSQLEKAAKDAGKKSGSAFSNAFKGGIAAIGAGLSIGAVGGFLGSAVQGAGQLEQSIGAISSVFKGNADQMHAWSKSAATDVGLTANEFNELGTLIGSQLKNGGTAMDELAPKTKGLIGMGADLSSMFGGTTKEAIEAMSSALRGESDPIERYGVSLTAARIEAKALEMGAEKVGKEFSQQAKQAAILALITEQTADAQGNFGRESDTFAQKQQVMSAKWGDLTAKIGGEFMPALTEAFGYISDTVLPAVGNFRDGLASLGQWVKDNAAWLVPLTAAVAGYAIAMGTLSIIDAVRKWMVMAAAAQWGLNAAMTANPVGIVVAAIAALVGALVWLYNNNEDARRIMDAAWKGIQTAVLWAWENVLRPAFEWISAFVRDVLGPAFNWLWVNVIKPVFGFIQAYIGAWWTVVKFIFDALVAVIRNVLGPVFGWLWKTIIKPAFDGIGAAIKWVWENVLRPVFNTLGDFITKTIPDAFSKGVGFIKKHWDKIQAIAKAPVKFVVDTVINDGLIGGLNGIAGFLGIDKLPRVALPAGFAEGGYTGPGRKHQPAGIVHAGEVVFSQADVRRHGGVSAVERLRRSAGTSPFAGQAADLWGGFQEEIKARRALNVSGSAPSWSLPTAIRAWDGAAGLRVKPGTSSPNATVARMPFGGNFPAYAVGYAFEDGGILLNSAAEGRLSPTMRRAVAIHEIGHVLGLPHVTNRSSVMHPMMASAMQPTAFDIANIQRMYGGKGSPTSGLGDSGFNPVADIIEGLVSKFKDMFKSAGFVADLAIGIGKKLMDNVAGWVGQKLGFGGPERAAQSAPFLHDNGGVLNPGLSSVLNATRKPEAILNARQWADMHRLATRGEGPGTQVNINGNVGWMPDQLAAEIEVQKRRTQTMAGMSGVVFA